MAYNRASEKDNAPEMIERVVYLNRVSKTVKGGRVMKFSALVVVGDGKGTVGYGLGKAAEVSEAILKGIANAKKNLQKVVLAETTIPHEVIGIFGAGKVLLKPAPVGTGVLAGGAVRAVMEAAGISNIRAKCLRSNNPQNVVKATMQGLLSLRGPEEVARPASCRRTRRQRCAHRPAGPDRPPARPPAAPASPPPSSDPAGSTAGQRQRWRHIPKV